MSNSREVENLSAALREAVRANNIPAVQKLLKLEVEQLADEKEGNTPLHLAAKAGYSKMVALLLQYNAHRGVKNKKGYTPIQLTESEATILEFTKYPTDSGDSYEYSSRLLRLIRLEQYDLAIALLKAGAKPNGYSYATDNSTALHLAVVNTSSPKSLTFIKTLLNHKADKARLRKREWKESFTPIEDASSNSKWDVVKLFAQYPTDKEDNFHYSATLLDAAKENQTDVVIELLKAGADADRWHQDYNFAIHWAVKHDNLPLFKALLEYGSDPYRKVSGEKSLSACELATSLGRFDFIAACAEYKKTKTLPGLLENCIGELESYTKKWRTSHSTRAVSLIVDLKNLLETKKINQPIQPLDPQKIVDIFTIANDVFTLHKTIVSNKDAPYYAQPPKGYYEDEYNEIIKKYAKKLEKFVIAEKKEEVPSLIKEESAPTFASDPILNFDSKSVGDSERFSNPVDMQELSIIQPSFATLMKNHSFFTAKLIEIQGKKDPELVEENDTLASIRGLKVLP